MGVCEWSLFCYALLSGVSFLQSSGRGRKNWLLYFKCLLAVEWLWCAVSLPHGVIVVFPGHTLLLFEVHCT